MKQIKLLLTFIVLAAPAFSQSKPKFEFSFEYPSIKYEYQNLWIGIVWTQFRNSDPIIWHKSKPMLYREAVNWTRPKMIESVVPVTDHYEKTDQKEMVIHNMGSSPKPASLGAGQCALETVQMIQDFIRENSALVDQSGIDSFKISVIQMTGDYHKAAEASKLTVSRIGHQMLIEAFYADEMGCVKPEKKHLQKAALKKHLTEIGTLSQKNIWVENDPSDKLSKYQLAQFLLAYEKIEESKALKFHGPLVVRIRRDRGIFQQDREKPQIIREKDRTVLYLEYAAASDNLDLVRVNEIKEILIKESQRQSSQPSRRMDEEVLRKAFGEK